MMINDDDVSDNDKDYNNYDGGHDGVVIFYAISSFAVLVNSINTIITINHVTITTIITRSSFFGCANHGLESARQEDILRAYAVSKDQRL